MRQQASEQGLREVVAALTNTIEGFEAEVSPQLARAVAATVLVKREIANEYGLLTEADVRRSLELTAESEFPDLFSIPYRKQVLFPGFQLEAVVGGAGAQRIRPFISRLKKLALERSWRDEDVVFSLVSPTTYLGDERSFAVHLVEGYDPEALYRAFEEKMGVEW